MRILRTYQFIHSFDEAPRENDIHDGYVTVVTDSKGNTKDMLYSLEGGWNTVGKVSDSNEYLIAKETMKAAYVGWVSVDFKRIIERPANWLDTIEDLIEEVEMERRNDPQKYDTEDEQAWWNDIDELYSALLTAKDHAQGVA